MAQPDEVGKAPRRGTIKTFCSERCGAGWENLSPSRRFWAPIDHGPVHIVHRFFSDDAVTKARLVLAFGVVSIVVGLMNMIRARASLAS
jgi:hypothetical protein